MLIGQTHKVDLAHPVDYVPGTIYKFGSVVKKDGNLYVANAYIPAADSGPGDSKCWEQVSEAPKIDPESVKATAPFGYLNGVTELKFDNTGKEKIQTHYRNIYLPAGTYAIDGDDVFGGNILGPTSCYQLTGEYDDTDRAVIVAGASSVHYDWPIGTNKNNVTIKNLAFKNITAGLAIYSKNPNAIITFEDCAFINTTVNVSNSISIFINCTFRNDNAFIINNASDYRFFSYGCCCDYLGTDGKNALGSYFEIWHDPIIYNISEAMNAKVYNATIIN